MSEETNKFVKEYGIKVPESIRVHGDKISKMLLLEECSNITELREYVSICNMMRMAELERPKGEELL